ncbi:major facilitator superfamily transporter [Penicillium angulare]|uniref:Major facilitator superfamily transporter n=1 Tax=Penicillium angulare TaxID=116970 RepID=A0A9W9KK33_9EURO|nr:major facilitator superfamily transporter [Penicillium angulare]
MALRALQGFFESNISPGFLMLTVCNLILYGIARHVEAHGGIAAWRCISLFLGSLTLAGAFAASFLLGLPHEVRWLNEDEKRMANARTIDNQIAPDDTAKKWSWPQVKEAFQDPQLYFSIVNSFLANIPNGYGHSWLSTHIG